MGVSSYSRLGMNRQARRRHLQMQQRRRTHLTHKMSRVRRNTKKVGPVSTARPTPPPKADRLGVNAARRNPQLREGNLRELASGRRTDVGSRSSRSMSSSHSAQKTSVPGHGTALVVAPVTALAVKSVPPDQSVSPRVIPAKAASASALGSLSWPWRLSLYGLRLLISGVGLATIVGTVLAILHPEQKVAFTDVLVPEATTAEAVAESTPESSPPSVLEGQPGRVPQLIPGQELTDVKAEVEALATSQEGLTLGAFFYSLDTGHFVDIAGNQSFPAASTIKIPILIAFFQAVDAGQVRLDEPLVMRPDLIASEAGAIQYDPPNSEYPALEIADLMITISDNTATNMLIDRLGGAAALNQRFQGWGMQHTTINALLPDLEGTNTVSPQDLATLFLRLGEGELLSEPSRNQALDIMSRTVTNTLLPQGLEEGATIAHKTGDIGSVVGDAGLIQTANGQRYVAAALVTRPHNDSRAQELIRQVSRITYARFNQSPLQSPVSPASPVD